MTEKKTMDATTPEKDREAVNWWGDKLLWGMFFIVAGVILLLANLNVISIELSSLWRLWPIAIIIVGLSVLSLRGWLGKVVYGLAALMVAALVWMTMTGVPGSNSAVATEQYSIEPTSEDIKRLHVDIKAGASAIDITSGVDPALVTGSFNSNAASLQKSSSVDDDNRPEFEQLTDMGRMYMVGISEAMNRAMPKVSQSHILTAVHNAVDVTDFPFVANKKNYYITLARFTPDKAQHVAARLAAKHKLRLRMAGTVAGMGSPQKLILELSNPLSKYRASEGFRYYSDKILPYVIRHPRITYSGNLSGKKKMKFLSEAKALLFPIDWEEPFGMAVIEALACGTPVVAMNRGAMPEIIEHGVNGFLANTEQEFEEYLLRVNEIDPAACRKSVEDTFSALGMAKQYVERYREVIELSKKRS